MIKAENGEPSLRERERRIDRGMDKVKRNPILYPKQSFKGGQMIKKKMMMMTMNING